MLRDLVFRRYGFAALHMEQVLNLLALLVQKSTHTDALRDLVFRRYAMRCFAARCIWSRYSVYLHYWYKSTHTDAPRCDAALLRCAAYGVQLRQDRVRAGGGADGASRCSLYLLYQYKSTSN